MSKARFLNWCCMAFAAGELAMMGLGFLPGESGKKIFEAALPWLVMIFLGLGLTLIVRRSWQRIGKELK